MQGPVYLYGHSLAPVRNLCSETTLCLHRRCCHAFTLDLGETRFYNLHSLDSRLSLLSLINMPLQPVSVSKFQP